MDHFLDTVTKYPRKSLKGEIICLVLNFRGSIYTWLAPLLWAWRKAKNLPVGYGWWCTFAYFVADWVTEWERVEKKLGTGDGQVLQGHAFSDLLPQSRFHFRVSVTSLPMESSDCDSINILHCLVGWRVHNLTTSQSTASEHCGGNWGTGRKQSTGRNKGAGPLRETCLPNCNIH